MHIIWGESLDKTVAYAAKFRITCCINPKYSAWLLANVNDYKENELT